MELFLVRHGETDENSQKVIQGWMDTDLNSSGLEQARVAAEIFDENIEVIYSSDLKRTVQTAEFFKKKFPDVPYHEDARLRERNYGEATGNPHDNYDWNIFWAVPSDQRPLRDAESLDEFNERVLGFIADMRAQQYKKILVVTHQGTINRIQDLLFGKPHMKYGNASITRISL